MKTSTIIASAAILLTIASCGNNATKSSADAAQTAAATTTAQPTPEGVTTRKIDTLTLITLKDNDGEKRMPNKLFYGKADSAKVEKLSPEVFPWKTPKHRSIRELPIRKRDSLAASR